MFLFSLFSLLWGVNYADLVSLGLVELHEFGEIKLGLLEDLDLLDEDVLEWEDFLARVRDLSSNIFGEAIGNI